MTATDEGPIALQSISRDAPFTLAAAPTERALIAKIPDTLSFFAGHALT
jgi:hypothetical protein